MYQNTFFDTAGGRNFTKAICSIAKSLEKIANAKNSDSLIDEQTAEKIYREKEHQYLLEDAKLQCVDYVTRCKENGCEDDADAILDRVEKENGKDIWEVLVNEFEDLRDCNVAFNDTWNCVMEKVLGDDFI